MGLVAVETIQMADIERASVWSVGEDSGEAYAFSSFIDTRFRTLAGADPAEIGRAHV